MRTHTKIPRAELVAALVERDGLVCQYPGNEHALDLNGEGSQEVTIDHWIPVHFGKANDWTVEQIWDISNLKLMCKRHNARKGDLVPNEDGTLPDKPRSKFRYRRDKRAGRPEECNECFNGHNLAPDEVCASCGADAQRFPRWAKVKFQDCDHELLWCIWCSIGVVERPTSVAIAMRQADSDEIGEHWS